eukprot:g2787.t1
MKDKAAAKAAARKRVAAHELRKMFRKSRKKKSASLQILENDGKPELLRISQTESAVASSSEDSFEIYLRLALKYHPDKLLKAERSAATELFQAIAAVYEDLLRPFGGKIPKRVKTQTAAAAELGDVKALQRLLIELPSRAEDYVGAVPLMFAAKGGCIEAAELLVRYNADVHAETPFGWSVLVYAALSDQGHMVRWLAKEGARVTGHELQLAAFGGYHRGLEALIEHYDQELSADSKRGLSPIQLVEQLCAAKADPNAMDKNGQSAVSLARRKNLNQVASILQRFAASRL